MNAYPIRPTRCPGPNSVVLPALLLALVAGCGTTRMTDSTRTATEQLLISNAIDHSVSEFDFRGLAGKKVYFDAQYLDGTVDKGYVVSSLRQHLLASGCLLQEERKNATYVVEARSGGVGTDHSSLLVGVPQMNVPTLVPGQPSQIPEIPLAKKNDQNGVAKIAVFAYNRLTGERLWQSGVVQSQSSSKDVWVLGAGPFQRGSIRTRTTFAGEPILSPFGLRTDEQARKPAVPVTEADAWVERLPAPVEQTDPFEHFGSGTLSRLALAAYLQSRLAEGSPSSSIERSSAAAPRPATAPTESRRPPAPLLPPAQPDITNVILTNQPQRNTPACADKGVHPNEEVKPGG
jgi:hypothetical protein